MFTENGMQIDEDAMEQILRNGDVIAVGFLWFPERLLIDTRTDAETGPLVAVVAPVANLQERYHWLGRHRAMFGMPEAFSFFTWPQTVRGMAERDALATLRRRLAATSNDGSALLDQALEKLIELEREAMKAAIRGDKPWETIWAA
jgi:hypothetical protein